MWRGRPGGLDVTYNSNIMDPPPAAIGEGAGGKIILNVGSLASPSAPIVLNADGYGSGNGGTIAVTINSTATQTIGTGNGQFSLSAQNGLSTASGANAFGGSVSLTTLGALLVADPTDNLKVTQSNGGGSVNGGSISLTGSQISAAAGGVLAITNNGVLNGLGGKISITETGTNVDAKLGNASGDNFYLVAQGGGIATSNGSLSVTTTGNIYLTTDGGTTDNVLGANLSAVIGASGANGGGGTLSLNGNSILNMTTPGSGLNFDAAGNGTGFGGTVNLTVNHNQSINIGKDLSSGEFQFDVANGAMGVSAGRVSVTIGSLSDTTGTGHIDDRSHSNRRASCFQN